MNQTCEFATGAEADANGFPVIIYCESPATDLWEGKQLCYEHFKQEKYRRKGGYIYRQGKSGGTLGVPSKKFKVITEVLDDGWGDPFVDASIW